MKEKGAGRLIQNPIDNNFFVNDKLNSCNFNSLIPAKAKTLVE